MAAIDRGFDSLSFLSDAMREGLRRRLRELGGLTLIVLATLVALALATWSVQDPSLSHATNAPVRNILGVPGAIVADLLTQLFGLAALAFVGAVGLTVAWWAGLGVDGSVRWLSEKAVLSLGHLAQRLQTGRLQEYLFATIVGIVAIIFLVAIV